jgi:hypothetical protein
MRSFCDRFAPIGTALILAAAGVAGLIDQTTMLVLVIMLICCWPGARRCRLRWEA